MNEMNQVRDRGGRLQIPRSRGAASGLLLILLGLWGAAIPFVGPSFDFAYNPQQGAAWSAARGWLEVLPGAVAVVGGLLLVWSTNRATAMLGGWLSLLGGAWFVVGRVVSTTLTIGHIGAPVADTETKAAWLQLSYFYGLGAAIVFLGGVALGRLSVRSVRDVDHAQRAAVARPAEPDSDAVTDTTGTPAQPEAESTGARHAIPTEENAPEEPVRRSWRDRLRGRRDVHDVADPPVVSKVAN
jgi:hypothetical protein